MIKKFHQIIGLVLVFSFCLACNKTAPPATTKTVVEEKKDSLVEIKVAPIQDIRLSQISDLYAKNDDTLRIVNYWATYCSPCVAEMPFFVKMQQKYAAEKVKIYLIGTDTFSEIVKTRANGLVQKHKVQNAYIINDPSRAHFMVVNPEYDGDGIPYTVFVKGGKRKAHAGIIADENEFIKTVADFLK